MLQYAHKLLTSVCLPFSTEQLALSEFLELFFLNIAAVAAAKDNTDEGGETELKQ